MPNSSEKAVAAVVLGEAEARTAPRRDDADHEVQHHVRGDRQRARRCRSGRP